MGTKKVDPAEKSLAKAKWVGFVDIDLPKGTDASALLELFDAAEPLDVVEALLEAGYKVTISKHWDTGARIVSATGAYNFCPNAGYTTSTWASEVDAGILGTGWKCLLFNQGKPWEFNDKSGVMEL